MGRTDRFGASGWEPRQSEVVSPQQPPRSNGGNSTTDEIESLQKYDHIVLFMCLFLFPSETM